MVRNMDAVIRNMDASDSNNISSEENDQNGDSIRTKVVMLMPSLLIINKSDWSFFIKGECEQLKKLDKQSIEYCLISSVLGVQAC